VDVLFLSGQLPVVEMRQEILKKYALDFLILRKKDYSAAFDYLDPMMHGEEIRKSYEEWWAYMKNMSDADCEASFSKVSQKPLILQVLTKQPSVLQKVCFARSQKCKRAGEIANAVYWVCRAHSADFLNHDGGGGRGGGYNSGFGGTSGSYCSSSSSSSSSRSVSEFLDQFLHEGRLNELLGIFSAGGYNGDPGQPLRVANPATATEGPSLGSNNVLLTLPDLPSGRLFFYANLAWIRSNNNNNNSPNSDHHMQYCGGETGTANQPPLNLPVKLLEQGLCPLLLVEDLITNDIASVADLLSMADLLKILQLVQKFKQDPLGGAGLRNSGALPGAAGPVKFSNSFADVELHLRNALARVMLNTPQLDDAKHSSSGTTTTEGAADFYHGTGGGARREEHNHFYATSGANMLLENDDQEGLEGQFFTVDDEHDQ